MTKISSKFETVKEFMAAGRAAGHDSLGIANDDEAISIRSCLKHNLPILRFINSVDGDFQHLREELNNLTTPAREELFRLLIAVRTKAEAQGHKQPLPSIGALSFRSILESSVTLITTRKKRR